MNEKRRIVIMKTIYMGIGCMEAEATGGVHLNQEKKKIDWKMRRKQMGEYGVYLFLVVILLSVVCSKQLKVQWYTEYTNKVSETVRLAVLTDLHSSYYGKNQQILVKELERTAPDAVLLVGDIADDKVPHEGTRVLLEQIGDCYPCYYVSGNHEYWAEDPQSILNMIASYGVRVLEGESEEVCMHGQSLLIAGVDDPDARQNWLGQFTACQDALDPMQYAVLLSHRPELASYYEDSGFDLVVSGHAHGGQIRIPGLLNGLIAPDQGFFPKYAGGRYELGETVMIVSRGLCKNILPRVFNRPEVVIVEISPKD